MSYNLIEKQCKYCKQELLLSLKDGESIIGEVFCSPNCYELYEEEEKYKEVDIIKDRYSEGEFRTKK